MGNPWENISLQDYENHMSLDSVRQLQTLDLMMKSQLDSFPADSVMILGVAGGNGLGHVNKDKYHVVYGVDINEDYLKAASVRYPELEGILKCIRTDLTGDIDDLPSSDLVIADLLIEYIGYEAFARAVNKVDPSYVSCIIQINTGTDNWVSDSPYVHSFDCLDEVHHQMEEAQLADVMEGIGYKKLSCDQQALPNGKALVRIDFGKV